MRDEFEHAERMRGQSRARGRGTAGRGSEGRSSAVSGSRRAGNYRGSGIVGTRRSTAAGGRSTGHGTYAGRNHGRKLQPEGPNMKLVLGAVVAFLVVGGGLVFMVRNGFLGNAKSVETETAIESTVDKTEKDLNTIQEDLYLDLSEISPDAALLDMKDMNREALKQAIQQSYTWNLVVKNANPSIDSFKMPDLSIYDEKEEASEAATGEENDNDGSVQEVEVDNPYATVTIRPEASSFAVPDLIAAQVDTLVEQIFSDYAAKQNEETSVMESEETGAAEEESSEAASTTGASAAYKLTLSDMSSTISDYMKQLAIVWKMNPQNGDITSYDAEQGEFVFGGSVAGYAVNADATAQKVMAAIEQHNYDTTIECEGEKVSASDSSMKSKYGTIGSFTTKTTGNAVRNKNIKLAAAAINGTVLQPGEEFSFNKTVGQRTEAKGYGGAPAYNGGEVVTEVGGGVCQVSSTLYNAVFRSGLTTTYRRSHTFAPSYVTPGTDATVSWPGPDYQFINDSKHAIGIRAWYEDQTVTVQIYGVRVLPEGVSWELTAEKTADLPVPAPKIITPDQGTPSAGTAGSEWQAYKIIHKADGTTEKVKDHIAHYSGHAPKQYAENAAESTLAESSTGETTTSGESASSAAETSLHESSPNNGTTGETKASPAPAPETSASESVKSPETKDADHEAIEAPGQAAAPTTGDDDIIQEGP